MLAESRVEPEPTVTDYDTSSKPEDESGQINIQVVGRNQTEAQSKT